MRSSLSRAGKWRRTFGIAGTSCILGLFCLLSAIYYWTENSDSLFSSHVTKYWRYSEQDAQKFALKNSARHLRLRGHRNYISHNLSFDYIIKNIDVNSKFDINGSDVIVFVHIQKTAGTTFERALVHNLDLVQPCECTKKKTRKRCKCLRPGSLQDEWLFSRFSTGWQCGLHADWTELVVSNCVDNVLDRRQGYAQKRRYFYTTFLREPTSRYISEFRHVSRGATWRSSPHVCNGRPPTPAELPLCFDPDAGWLNVSLSEFLDCPFNLATNRQTRMLADLTLVGCYNNSALGTDQSKRDAIMLESAKRNLESMAFFGLQEELRKSQYIFERTFEVQFIKNIKNLQNVSKSDDTVISDEQLNLIRQKNLLDLELYEFARQLFSRRFESLKSEDEVFVLNYNK